MFIRLCAGSIAPQFTSVFLTIHSPHRPSIIPHFMFAAPTIRLCLLRAHPNSVRGPRPYLPFTMKLPSSLAAAILVEILGTVTPPLRRRLEAFNYAVGGRSVPSGKRRRTVNPTKTLFALTHVPKFQRRSAYYRSIGELRLDYPLPVFWMIRDTCG